VTCDRRRGWRRLIGGFLDWQRNHCIFVVVIVIVHAYVHESDSECVDTRITIRVIVEITIVSGRDVSWLTENRNVLNNHTNRKRRFWRLDQLGALLFVCAGVVDFRRLNRVRR
jgi:hypothetical protein